MPGRRSVRLPLSKGQKNPKPAATTAIRTVNTSQVVFFTPTPGDEFSCALPIMITLEPDLFSREPPASAAAALAGGSRLNGGRYFHHPQTPRRQPQRNRHSRVPHGTRARHPHGG